MTDLKLIDELLDMLKPTEMTWKEFEEGYSNITREAIGRLREEWWKGEMEDITLSIATYFGESDEGAVPK